MKNKSSFFKRFIFIEIFVIISSIISVYIFNPIYTAKNVIIPYAIHPFNISTEHPIWWKNIKLIFCISHIIANTIIANTIYSTIIRKIVKKTISKNNKKENIQQNSNQLAIYVGKNESNQLIYIPEKGLYQNILITRNNRKR